MSNYFKQIALRGSGTANSGSPFSMIVPTNDHVFAPGNSVSDNLEEVVADTTTSTAPKGLTPPETKETFSRTIKNSGVGNIRQEKTAASLSPPKPSGYFKKQLQRFHETAIVTQTQQTQQTTIIPPDKELQKLIIQKQNDKFDPSEKPDQPGQPVPDAGFHSLKDNKSNFPQVPTLSVQEQVKTSALQPADLPSFLLPASDAPVQKIPSQNKLVIGKITVEIVNPPTPAVAAKERVVTRIVNANTQQNNFLARNKLCFGLGQI